MSIVVHRVIVFIQNVPPSVTNKNLYLVLQDVQN